MIWSLRNIAIRLWVSCLLSFPLTFFIMPVLFKLYSKTNPLYAGIVLVGILFFGFGFFLNFFGEKLIASLIKEGETWERAGIVVKSEKKYNQALRIYDTFLISPVNSKKIAKKLTGVLSKFFLTSSKQNENFHKASCIYLLLNPKDKDIAKLWLKNLYRTKRLGGLEQDVLTKLAENHYNNPKILLMITEIFLETKRVDFTAKKIYQTILDTPELKQKYDESIDDLIDKDEDQSLASKDFPKIKMDTSLSVKFLKSAQLIYKKILSIIDSCFCSIKAFIVEIINLAGSVISFLILYTAKVFEFIKERENIQLYLKLAAFAFIFIPLLLFMINTFSHISPSRVVQNEEVKIKIDLPKPFTIQVAAYLKQAHADSYLNNLKKKGIEGSIKKVAGGGKTWFLVNVSEFIDKKSAAKYGQQLKDQGIIDDFFVNNK